MFAPDTVVDVEGLDFVLEGGDELGECLQPLEGVGLVGRADVDVESCGRVNRKRGILVLAHHVEHFPDFIEALSIIHQYPRDDFEVVSGGSFVFGGQVGMVESLVFHGPDFISFFEILVVNLHHDSRVSEAVVEMVHYICPYMKAFFHGWIVLG